MNVWKWRKFSITLASWQPLNFVLLLNAMNLVEILRLPNEWIIYFLNSVLKLSFWALEELEEFEQLKQLVREMCRAKSKVKKTRAREIFFVCVELQEENTEIVVRVWIFFDTGEWEMSRIANFGVKWGWANFPKNK